MLATTFIALRFVHFTALMLAFGCLLYGAWWAAPPLRARLMRHFLPLLRQLLLLNALAALLLLWLQGGLMGDGWRDVWQPAIWKSVAGTQFGRIWIWQILLA